MVRGKSKSTIELIRTCREILQEIQPATVRAVCYKLFTRGMIPDMSKKSTARVSAHLVIAREEKLIPWEWFVDETREAERVLAWSSPEAIIDSAVRGYRRDYWQDQPGWIEVWSEKGTVRGTLAPVLNKFGVTFRVMHGFGSATTVHGIAEETARAEKPLTVLYVGDWDPSGLNMSEHDLPSRLERYNGQATFRRIALNADDVGVGTELPWFEAKTKEKDSRYRWFVKNFGTRCWELDALSPVVLRQRVEDAIVGMLDIDAWNHAIGVERAEVDSMQDFALAWRRSRAACMRGAT
jgi:hypothetical protein